MLCGIFIFSGSAGFPEIFFTVSIEDRTHGGLLHLLPLKQSHRQSSYRANRSWCTSFDIYF